MKTKNVLLWILAFLPIVVTLIVLPMFPDTIPTHYGFDGTANRWGSKYEMLIIPVIMIAFVALMLFIGKYANKQKDYTPTNQKILVVTNYIVALVFNGLSYWFLYLAYTNTNNLYETDVDVTKLFAILLGISYVFLGNVLPKCKRNAVIGIRSKWTLANDNVWYKTHRLGGVLLFLSGIILIGLCLTVLHGATAVIVAFGIIIVVSILLIIYSFVQYKTEIEKGVL